MINEEAKIAAEQYYKSAEWLSISQKNDTTMGFSQGYSHKAKELEDLLSACKYALQMCESRVIPTEKKLASLAARLRYTINK